MALVIGDRVLVGKVQERGLVRFIGPTKFQAGEWIGVELENAAGKNDGSVMGVKYFECPPARGIFVRPAALTKISADDEAAQEPASPAVEAKAAMNEPDARPDARPDAKADAKPDAKAHQKHATFEADVHAPPQQLDKEKAIEAAEVNATAFEEEQRVCLFGQLGTVRYVGATKFAEGIWVGLEFDDPVGRCDGAVRGTPYFRCSPNHGLFLQAVNCSIADVRRAAAGARTRGSRGRSMSRFSRSRGCSIAASSVGDEEILVEEQKVHVVDDEGNEIDIADIIAAFEESREELEGVQDLLDEANEREWELRAEIQELRSAAADAGTSGTNANIVQVSQPASIGGVDVFDNIILLSDSYKVTQHTQLPTGVETVYSYLEGRVGSHSEICFFGLQYFLKRYAVGQVVTLEKINAADRFFKQHFALGGHSGEDSLLFNRAGWLHILREHGGMLPVLIKAVPEGTVLPAGNVLVTVENTDPACFWLTNYLETLLSQVWFPTTVCTVSREQKRLIAKYLRETGSVEAVDCGLHAFKLHDFGFRSAGAVEAAALGGAGHLVNFQRSDTIPALVLAKEFYGLDCAAGSAPAADRASLAPWGREKEVNAMRNLLAQYPKGPVACIGDCHDLMNFCGSILGSELKSVLEERDGCLALRPGHLVGAGGSGAAAAALVKVLEALEAKFGSELTATGHKLLPRCVRVLQGDGGGLVAEALERQLSALHGAGWAADNLTFASGGGGCRARLGGVSGFGLSNEEGEEEAWAFVTSLMRVGGDDIALAVDSSSSSLPQRSGRMSLECENGQWTTVAGGKGDPAKDCLVAVFHNGRLLVDDGLVAIRKRAEGLYVPAQAGGTSSVRRGKPPSAAPPPGRPAWKAGGLQLQEKAAELKGKAESLLEKAGKLREIKRRQDEGKVSAADVEWVSQLYTECNGNLDRIASVCGVSQTILQQHEPKDAEDFARKLLAGTITGDSSDAARADLRGRLKEALADKKNALRRTTTKEMSGVASAEEVAMVSVIYTRCGGDLAKIAEACGLSVEVLKKREPVDAQDFGRKLLAGHFTEDASEAKKRDLRETIQSQLARQVSNLRRTQTKEAMGEAAPEDIAKLAKLYAEHRGNVDQLARLCGASVSLMRKRRPEDGEDFAQKLLAGVYTGDESSMAKAALRERLAEDLQRQGSQLRRTTTKEGGGPTEIELAACAKIYESVGGDLAKVAQVCGLPVSAFERSPPKNGKDFASKLFEGIYTEDAAASAKKTLRANLAEQILARKSTLRRTETKTGGSLSVVELEFVGKIYIANGGNLAKIAAICGVDADALENFAPENAEDFARKLYDGVFSTDRSEATKAKLRERLQADLMSQIKKLKPAVVKEVNQGPSRLELERVAKVFMQSRGNLETVAQQFGVSLEMLKRSPPSDGQDFARSLLDGKYTGDTSEIAKATLRDRLREELQGAASSLRRTTTKENVGPVVAASSADLERFSEVFERTKGDLDQLSDLFGLAPEIVKAKPPRDGMDFAARLLAGEYTGDRTELQRKLLRRRLVEDLSDKASMLRRTQTRASITEASSEELELLSKVYTKVNGSLTKLAQLCGAPLDLLQRSPPSDALDFARRMFRGEYTAEGSDLARDRLRGRLNEHLLRQASVLRRTETKVALGQAGEEDIAALAKIYSDCRGDPQRLSVKLGIDAELMQRSPPVDAKDFARRMLEGFFTGEAGDIARDRLRCTLRENIQRQTTSLKRTNTKELNGAVISEEDIELAARLFDQQEGRLDRIAAVYGLSLKLLQDAPPTGARDFAKRLLMGCFVADMSEEAKALMRSRLKEEITRASSTLKRTTTKEASGEASPEDLAALAKLYDDMQGDLDQLAAKFGVMRRMLDKEGKPKDGQDFAARLLRGDYSGDSPALAREAMRQHLHEDLHKQMSQLKRTSTKEALGEASEEDLQAISRLYNDHRASLEGLANAFHLNLNILKRFSPTDGQDFAKKLLSGAYTGDSTEEAKMALRQRLREDLCAQAAKLRRTCTKEATGEASGEDIALITQIYDMEQGDLSRLSQVCHLSLEALTARPPSHGADFARALLSGDYSVDIGEAAKASLRERLPEDIRRARPSLKRTTTKECGARSEASAEDIESCAALYTQANGDLNALSERFGADRGKLRASPPKDAIDFAKRLLTGEYTADAVEVTKSELRYTLSAEIARSASRLRRTATKEADGEATEEDLAAIAQLYVQHRGCLQQIAQACGLTQDLLCANSPSDAEDFAKKLLAGAYTGDSSALALHSLRTRLREDLQLQSTRLRRTTTKEAAAVAPSSSGEDIEPLVALFDQKQGDLEALAKACGISLEQLKAKWPEDGREFARNLLSGAYTGEPSEAAKASLRSSLEDQLQRSASKLKRTSTKEFEASSPEDVEVFAKLYAQCNGSLRELSMKFKLDFALLSANAPNDAEDFARQLLAGNYTKDNAESAKAYLRESLQREIHRTASKLKRTTTKEASGEASAEDLAAVGKLFLQHRGSPSDLAVKLGLSEALLRKHPPADAEDFAQQLLAGVYTGDDCAMAMQALREKLEEDLQIQAHRLRRTTTKEALGEASEEDLFAAQRLFEQHDGDLAKLSEVCGGALSFGKLPSPKDGREFAKLLFSGAYTSEGSAEGAKAQLREKLKEHLVRTASKLKRTTTKECSGEASEQDIGNLATLYAKYGGKLDKLAFTCGIKVEVIYANPPVGAEDFARKLLSGYYSADFAETAKAELRERLHDEIARSKSSLRRTTTKEMTGEASEEDIEAVCKLFASHRGCLESIASQCGLQIELLRANPPRDPREFAKFLLSGLYTGDMSEIAKRELRDRLAEDLSSKLGQLRRTETKIGAELASSDPDLSACARLWTELCGGRREAGAVGKIAERCGCSADAIMRNFPTDPDDFARKLFDGAYTGDLDAQQKQALRSTLRENIARQASQLKRTSTKEYSGLSEQDVAAVSALYMKHGGDLAKLAQLSGLSAEALQASPPSGAKDFAEKLLNGAYTVDRDEEAKKQLRDNLEGLIEVQVRQLKRTTTKEMDAMGIEPTPEEIEAMASFYMRKRGNLEAISAYCDITADLLRKSPPSSPEDFARKMLMGMYTTDKTQEALSTLRGRLKEELQVGLQGLKRTSTKEWDGRSSPSDIDYFAKLYQQHSGDSARLAEVCGLSVEVLSEKPPKSPQDFADNLLQGTYNAVGEALAAKRLRAGLRADLGDQVPQLRRTQTKTGDGLPDAEAVQMIAKAYDQHDGDIEELARFFSASPELIRNGYPSDGKDFAEKLLSGVYTDTTADEVRKQLLVTLGGSALKMGAMRLKRTQTKECCMGVAGTKSQDVTAMELIFHEAGGDLAKVAALTGTSLEKLKANRPHDGHDFAVRFLMGLYGDA